MHIAIRTPTGIITLITALSVSFASYAQVEDPAYQKMLEELLDHEVTEVSVKELVQRQKEYLFLDAREPQEFEVSHIKNSVHIGYNDFALEHLQAIPKENKIVVYCSVGYRSEKIAQKLLRAGYTDVSNLYGGIFEWVNTGQEVVYEGKVTKNIHGYDQTWSKWLKRGEVILK